MCLGNFLGVRWKLFLVCFTLVSSTSECVEAEQFPENRLVLAKQRLTNFYQHLRGKSQIHVGMSLLWSECLNDLHSTRQSPRSDPHVLWTHNNTLVTLDSDLWQVTRTKFNKVATLPHEYPYRVSFIKSMEWQDRVFLLYCYENKKCNLFTGIDGDRLRYLQPISDIPNIPVAAEFFTQAAHLFLVMIFKTENSILSKTTLYQWQETYMDRQLIPEMITTASTVTLFEYRGSIIFILGCVTHNRMKFPSQVWKREASGELERVQYLPTWNHVSLTHFVQADDNFLLAQEQKKAVIYWWRGDEFLQWIPVDRMLTHYSVSVSKSSIPPVFLIFSKKNILKMYVISSEKLDSVYEHVLDEAIYITSTSMYYKGGDMYLTIQFQYNNKTYLSLYELSINVTHVIPDEPALKQGLESKVEKVLSHANQGITTLDGKVEQLTSIIGTLLLTGKELTLNPQLTIVSEAVEVHKGEIINVTGIHFGITRAIQDLQSKILLLREEIKSHFNTVKNTKYNHSKHLITMGDLFFRNVTINSLLANHVNGKHLDPSVLLKVNSNYRRLENVVARDMSVNWLVLEHIGPQPVKDLLMEDWNIKVPVVTSVLDVNNLSIREDSTINNIMVSDLLGKNVTMISGDDTLNTIEQVEEQEDKLTLQLQDSTVVENIYVAAINTISVNNLLSSLFLKQKLNKIYGDIQLKKGLRINKLVNKSLVQPPAVHNQIPEETYPYYRVQNSKDTQNTTLFNPYPYYLNLNSVTRKARREPVKRKHKNTINAKVKIIGNLRVRRLVFQNSSLQTNNKRVPISNLDNIFWTYNSQQIINNPVNFTGGISMTQALTNEVINGVNLTQCATWNYIFPQLFIESVYVRGDISSKFGNMDDFISTPMLQHFNVLNVKHLQTRTINGENVDDVVRRDFRFSKGLKIVANKLKIKGNFDAVLINSMDIRKLLRKAIYVDEDTTLHNVTFQDITASSTKVEFLNNSPADLILGFIQTGENNSVHINGNLHVAKLMDVCYVNEKFINLSLVVDISKNNLIKGKKHFMGQIVSLNNLTVTSINGINTKNMFDSMLRTSGNQLITGFYTFRRANFATLFGVKSINGINTSNIMYTDQPHITLIGGVAFNSVHVNGDFSASSLLDGCVLPKVSQSVVFSSEGNWSSMRVQGNCTWTASAGGQIQRLLSSGITIDTDQSIPGNINITNLFSKSVQVHFLNNENITFVIEDSLSRNKTHQVFTGEKTFTNPVTCKSAEVKGDARCTTINDIEINKINNKLVRQNVDDDVSSRPIYGHKKFMSGFRAFVLACSDGINGILSSSLAQERSGKELPPLIVDHLVVSQNIIAEQINGIYLGQFLEDCVYTDSVKMQLITSSLLIKGNVIFEGNVTSMTINNVSTQDLLYTKTGKHQSQIKECQVFMSGVNIETNVTIATLNDRNVSLTYEENVKTSENVTIKGSVIVSSDVELESINAQEYIVGDRKLNHLQKAITP